MSPRLPRIPRARVRRIAVVAVGVVTILAATGGAVAAVMLPWPGHDRDVVTVTTAPVPAANSVVCAGPLLALGRDAAAAGLLQVAADATATVGVNPADAALTEEALVTPEVPDGGGAAVYSAPPVDRARTDVAAATVARVEAEDLRGLAAAPCTPPVMESWLVGGSGAVGAADLVILANPGDVVASVDLVVYGAQGETAPPAGRGVVVAPGTRVIVPVAAVALGEEAPVIRVTASTAPIQASLQTAITRTLVPGGVDQVAAAAAPATSQVIPGVLITEPDAAAADAATVLRLLAPAADTTARVTVTPARADAAGPAPIEVPLTAGAPLELQLAGYGEGVYTVRVEADEAVLAGVWHTTGFDADADFAWFPAAASVGVPSAVAVAEAPDPQLVIAAGADDAVVRVTAGAGAGQAVEVTVPAGRSVAIAAQPGESYLIDAGATLIHAAVVFAEPGALAGYTVVPADAAAPPVTVHPN